MCLKPNLLRVILLTFPVSNAKLKYHISMCMNLVCCAGFFGVFFKRRKGKEDIIQEIYTFIFLPCVNNLPCTVSSYHSPPCLMNVIITCTAATSTDFTGTTIGPLYKKAWSSVTAAFICLLPPFSHPQDDLKLKCR